MESKAAPALSLISPEPAHIEALDAAQAFAALGSEARLAVILGLVRAGPEGLAVGELQKRLDMPASTLSHHLKFLSQCGLLRQERAGRSLICTADFARIEGLAAFLTRECCREAAACDADVSNGGESA